MTKPTPPVDPAAGGAQAPPASAVGGAENRKSGAAAKEGRPKVESLEAARLEKQKAATESKLRTRKMDVASQIRALGPGKSLMGTPPPGGEGELDEFGLPPYCPVKPLGRDGDEFFFLNAAGGVTTLSPSASGKAYIDGLFSGQWPYLVWAWGRVSYDKTGPKYQNNYDAEKARVAMFDAATMKGPWNMVDNVRGRGAWRGEDGSLILHVGDVLLIDGFMAEDCGERKGKLYPKRPLCPKPAESEQPVGPESCGNQALALLKTWNWSRGELDAKLMLGWILAAMIGGALDWRATVFVTGDKATGKSTLQKVVAALLGDALIHAVETTAAGIYQLLKNDSVPVAVDELEADADIRKVKAVIELARVASSGGRMLRGGQDHHGRQFDLRSAFFFSSINAPALQPQDRSRMALLDLRPLEAMAAGPKLDLGELRQTGRELLRRVTDWWPRLFELLAMFRKALMDQGGHDGRGGDTFGTLAAFAHIALSDEMPTADELTQWAKDLNARELAEFEAATPNWKLALRHLLTAQPDAFRTMASKSIGALLGNWKKVGDGQPGDDEANIKFVKKKLADVGLGLVFPKGFDGHFEHGWLFVPLDHSELNKLYRDTKWQGMTGAPGVWTTALRQGPKWFEAEMTGLWRLGVGEVGAVKTRGTQLRLPNLFDMAGEVMEAEDAAE